jgi:hypothetical protein
MQPSLHRFDINCLCTECTPYVLSSERYTCLLLSCSLLHCTPGPKSAWVVDAAIFALCFGVCVMYGCFLGDLFSSLLSLVGSLPAALTTRTAAILGITSTILLPLCLLKDLRCVTHIAEYYYLQLQYSMQYCFSGSCGCQNCVRYPKPCAAVIRSRYIAAVAAVHLCYYMTTTRS